MSLTSPISTLSNISSPSSFYTAKATSPPGAGDVTNISSPDEAPVKLSYRDARQVPHELKEHCQIHLEERLCKTAINSTQILQCFLTIAKQSALPSNYSTLCFLPAARGRTRPFASLPSSPLPPRSPFSAHSPFIPPTHHAPRSQANFKSPPMLFNIYETCAPPLGL